MPVYEIKPEQGGKSRTVHRNLLLPCDSLPVERLENKQQNKQKKKTQTTVWRQRETLQENSDTDSDKEGALVWRSPRLRLCEDSRTQGRVPEPDHRRRTLITSTARPLQQRKMVRQQQRVKQTRSSSATNLQMKMRPTRETETLMSSRGQHLHHTSTHRESGGDPRFSPMTSSDTRPRDQWVWTVSR